MNFCSEAQAYQAIRRDWKRRRNYAQRAQTYHQWEADTGTRHPVVVRAVAATMKCEPKFPSLSRISVESLLKQAHKHQNDVSLYAHLLNQYRVKRDERK
jgi:hypothetical protein